MLYLIFILLTSNAYAGISFIPGDQAQMSKQSLLNLQADINDMNDQINQYEASRTVKEAMIKVIEKETLALVMIRNNSQRHLAFLDDLEWELRRFYKVVKREYPRWSNKKFRDSILTNYSEALANIRTLMDRAMNVGASFYGGEIPIGVK